MKEETCLNCGESREAIKRNKLFCATVDPQTGECDVEYPRHRFKPYSEKELKAIAEDEKALLDSMQSMVDFWKENPPLTNSQE